MMDCAVLLALQTIYYNIGVPEKFVQNKKIDGKGIIFHSSDGNSPPFNSKIDGIYEDYFIKCFCCVHT